MNPEEFIFGGVSNGRKRTGYERYFGDQTKSVLPEVFLSAALSEIDRAP
jgi:hypothetical protein